MKSTLFTLTTLLLLSVPTLLTSSDHSVAHQHRQKLIDEDVQKTGLTNNHDTMKSTLFTLTTLLLLSVPTLLTTPDHAVAQQHRQKLIEEDVPENALVPDPGVVSYTFRRQFSEDIPGTLDLIKEMGFSNIEFRLEERRVGKECERG